MQDPAAVTQLFRERGLKVTPQRQAIFGIMHRSPVGRATVAVVLRP